MRKATIPGLLVLGLAVGGATTSGMTGDAFAFDGSSRGDQIRLASDKPMYIAPRGSQAQRVGSQAQRVGSDRPRVRSDRAVVADSSAPRRQSVEAKRQVRKQPRASDRHSDR